MESNMTFIRYVGRKPRTRDTLCNTNAKWDSRGAVVPVPARVAAALLQHPTEFADVTELVLNEDPLPELPEIDTGPVISTGSPRDKEIRAAIAVINSLTEKEEAHYFPEPGVEGAGEPNVQAPVAFSSNADTALKQAIEVLSRQPEAQRREAFSASTGKPHVAALEAVLGYDIDAADRDRCWDEIAQDIEAVMAGIQH